MQVLFISFIATLLQISVQSNVRYPEISKQLVSSLIDTDCFLLSSFERNNLRFGYNLLATDVDNSNSFALSGWFQPIGHQLQGDNDSVLFYLTNDISNDFSSDVILIVGIKANQKDIFYQYKTITSLITYSSAFIQQTWYFLAFSFRWSSSNLSVRVDINQNSLTFNPYPNPDVFQFKPQGGIVISSTIAIPNMYPACMQIKNIQLHWDYFIEDVLPAPTPTQTSPIIDFFIQYSKYPAKLIYHFTMEKNDLFIQDFISYLRDRSNQENHLSMTGIDINSTPQYIEMNNNQQKTLSGLEIQDGFVIAYWIKIQDSTPIIAFSIDLGTVSPTANQIKVQHGLSQIQINTQTYTHQTLPVTDWCFFVFIFRPNNIDIYFLQTNQLQLLVPTTATPIPLGDLDSKQHEYIRIKIGNVLNSSKLSLRDFKVLKGISLFFNYPFENFSENCLIVYGLEKKRCLLCQQQYKMTNEGICIYNCPSSIEQAYNSNNFSKCESCQFNEVNSPYDCNNSLASYFSNYSYSFILSHFQGQFLKYCKTWCHPPIIVTPSPLQKFEIYKMFAKQFYFEFKNIKGFTVIYQYFIQAQKQSIIIQQQSSYQAK